MLAGSKFGVENFKGNIIVKSKIHLPLAGLMLFYLLTSILLRIISRQLPIQLFDPLFHPLVVVDWLVSLVVIAFIFLGKGRFAVLTQLIWGLLYLLLSSVIFGLPMALSLILSIAWLIALGLLLTKQKWAFILALIISFLNFIVTIGLNIFSLVDPLAVGNEVAILFAYLQMVIAIMTVLIMPLLVIAFNETENSSFSMVDYLYHDTWGVNLLYTVLSLGMFGFVWVGHLLHNVRQLTGQRTAVIGHMLGYIFVPFYSIYVIYLIQSRLKSVSSIFDEEPSRPYF